MRNDAGGREGDGDGGYVASGSGGERSEKVEKLLSALARLSRTLPDDIGASKLGDIERLVVALERSVGDRAAAIDGLMAHIDGAVRELTESELGKASAAVSEAAAKLCETSDDLVRALRAGEQRTA